MAQTIYLPKEAIDHIFPRRYLWRWKLYPHSAVNLLSVCGSCHGLKKTAENCLWRSDILGYVRQLVILNWPAQRIIAAARHYHFQQVIDLLARVQLCL
jgi:hypothetical protein